MKLLTHVIFHKFQDDISEYYNTDFNILRWLQGHNTLPIEEIARKMKFHLNLRAAWNLDELHKKERNHPIHKHWKYGITGPSGHMDNVIVNIEQVTFEIVILIFCTVIGYGNRCKRRQVRSHIFFLESKFLTFDPTS